MWGCVLVSCVCKHLCVSVCHCVHETVCTGICGYNYVMCWYMPCMQMRLCVWVPIIIVVYFYVQGQLFFIDMSRPLIIIYTIFLEKSV